MHLPLMKVDSSCMDMTQNGLLTLYHAFGLENGSILELSAMQLQVKPGNFLLQTFHS